MGQGATKFNVCVTAGPDAPDMLFHFRIKEEDVTVGQSALRPGASALDLAVQAASSARWPAHSCPVPQSSRR